MRMHTPPKNAFRHPCIICLEEKMRTLNKPWSKCTAIFALLFGLYFFLNAYIYFPYEISYPLFIGGIFILIFILYPATKKGKASDKPSWLDIALIAVCLAFTLNFMINYSYYVDKPGAYRTWDIIFALSAVLISIEACRRVLGKVMPIMAIVFIIYAAYGHFIPTGSMWNHSLLSWKRILMYCYSMQGIYGTITQIYARYVLLFVIFGAVLEMSGLGDLLIQLSMALVGRLRGGVAKTAVVSSALVGSIMGSGPANVAVTGVFTIPMMKKSGWPSDIAGAVETVASSGGAIMPPIMGSVAFIVAANLGVPYQTVVTMSFLPAIMFYLALYIQTHFWSYKLDIKPLSKAEVPEIWPLLKKDGILLIPFVMIFVLIITGRSPCRSAFLATIVIFAICLLVKRKKPSEILKSFERGTINSLTVAGSGGVIGVIVAVLTLSALPLKFSSIALKLAGGHLLPLIFLVFIVAYIFGMGMAVVPSYMLLSTIAVPALMTAGLSQMTAHFIIMWFSIASMWTPPVAVSSFVASSIAQESPYKISKRAMPMGMGLYIIPFMFAYGKLLNGTPLEIILSGITGMLSVVSASAGIVGFTSVKLTLVERILFFAAAILLITEVPALYIAGGVAFAVLLIVSLRRAKKTPKIAA